MIKISPLLAPLLLVVAVQGVAAQTTTAKPFKPQTAAQIDQIEQRTMRPVDNAELVQEAEAREAQAIAIPYVFAEPLAVNLTPATSGNWQELENGDRVWRLRLRSEGAVSINLGFSRFDPPLGAALWISSLDGTQTLGPYTRSDRGGRGRLFTPVIENEAILLELFVPADTAIDPGMLELDTLNHGFRYLLGGQGDCNIDVICEEGDPFRDQIRSVARYTVSGTTFCTGQLLNNTSRDATPYFLTADHCGVTSQNADTMVVYWNYESSVCRQPGEPGDGSLKDNQTGATWRASKEESDFTLLELDSVPSDDFNVFWSGWDRKDTPAQSGVTIHHPGGDEKRISFDNDPVTPVDIGYGTETHWRVREWDLGTTEVGSSGSGLWDSFGRLVGQFTGGFTSCAQPETDYFGRLDVSWDSGETPQERLVDWLDPIDSGVTSFDGSDHPGVIHADGFESCAPPDPLCE